MRALHPPLRDGLRHRAIPGLCAALVLLLAGCATSPPSLYQWEGYQPQVYGYFQGKSKEEQITALEEGLQKIAAAGKTPPPGYHAQLGLLYMQTGKEDQMVQQFETEKTLFPESAAYIDFLLKNARKKEEQAS